MQIQQQQKDASGNEHQLRAQIDNSPLPSAQELDALSRIDPTLIEFVKTELKIQYQSDRQIRESTEKTIRHLSVAGLYLGSLLAFFCLACATFLIYSGFTWSGSIFGIASLASVVAVIVNAGANRRRADKEIPNAGTPPSKQEP